MNDITSDQVIDGSNLPANKKAKAIQKRKAAENSYEALQLKKSAANMVCIMHRFKTIFYLMFQY